MNKLRKIQIFRTIIQILMLILLPGLFIMAFNGLKEIVKMIISGNFNFIQALPSLLEFITTAIFTIIMGRVFCGWFCAFGAYNDLIYLASKKIFKTKFKMNENADSFLKYIKYVVLFTILFISVILGSSIFSSASPWDAFAQITDLPNILSSLPIGLMLLLLITIGAFFIERFFCRYLCPLGAFFTLISKASFLKIRKPSDKCGKCRICTNNCSMGLKLYKAEKIHGGDCINCLKCIEACPRKNTCVNAFGQDMNSATASSIALAAVMGIYGVSSLGGSLINQSSQHSSSSIISDSISSPTQKYKDGTYTGTGTGFRGGTTKIELTIANGKISGINTISTQDTPQFYERAFDTEVNEMISSQSPDVDTVSGATFSSSGIIDAVKDALSKAVTGTEINSNSENKSSYGNEANPSSANNSSSYAAENAQGQSAEKNAGSSSSAQASGSSSSATVNQGNYKDGTYSGTGTGFRGGTTEISVTISGGRITGIVTASTQDTPRFYQHCESTIIGEMLSSQSSSVDTVSGATYSSSGIIEAVKDALSKAINS